MKRLALVLVVGCGGHASDGATRFTYRAPAVGQAIAEDDTQTSKLTLTTPTATSQLDETAREVSHSQVLAVDGDAITQLRVVYDTKETDDTVDGKAEVVTSPLAGHTYLLAFANGALTATHVEGSAVGDDERTALLAEHADLGKRPPLAAVIAAHAWKQGEAVALSADELGALGRGDADNHPTAGSLTLQGVDGGVATFATAVTVTRNDERAHVETQLTGTVRVTSDLRPLEITTTGTAKGEMANQMNAPTLAGTTQGHTTFAY